MLVHKTKNSNLRLWVVRQWICRGGVGRLGVGLRYQTQRYDTGLVLLRTMPMIPTVLILKIPKFYPTMLCYCKRTYNKIPFFFTALYVAVPKSVIHSVFGRRWGRCFVRAFRNRILYTAILGC